MKTEYMSLSDATRETLAHLTFFRSHSIELRPPVLYTDDQAAEFIAKLQPDYQRSNHIDVRYHFLRDRFEKSTLNIDQFLPISKTACIFWCPPPKM
jgi:hypothetical protein